MKRKAIGYALLTAATFAVQPPYLQAETAKNTTEEMSDTWLEAKLDTTIMLNRHLSFFDIDTDVENQVAYLSGTVQSDVEKDLAGEVARSINGIKSVENKITVDKSKTAARNEAKASTERSFTQTIDDLTTTASIKSKYLTNGNIDGLNINIDTLRGRVTLKGNVKSDAEKALAEQIAENTEGVREVDNKLTVNAAKKVS